MSLINRFKRDFSGRFENDSKAAINMFCPKCGSKNPNSGKYCRKCGSDLKLVSDALSGKLTYGGNKKGKKKGKAPTWEEALTLLFVSVAFFAISIFLAFQPMAAFWWFWILVPAFATLAQGIGKVIVLRQERDANSEMIADETMAIPGSKTAGALPPQQTEFEINIPGSKHRTKDLVPPSVVEETTRKLEFNSENESMDGSKAEK